VFPGSNLLYSNLIVGNSEMNLNMAGTLQPDFFINFSVADILKNWCRIENQIILSYDFNIKLSRERLENCVNVKVDLENNRNL
jgi:hypothetical protein